jgi:hypothetical protein
MIRLYAGSRVMETKVDTSASFSHNGLERIASSLFSTNVFGPIVAGRRAERAELILSQIRGALGLASETNGEVVAAAFELVSKQYRSEYYYRNIITSNIFVGKYRASNSAILNELRLGSAIADCVVINGRGTVYEIKTAYDSAEKLPKQIQNYYHVFGFVNVVVPSLLERKYYDLLQESSVGLYTVNSRGQLSQIRPATYNDNAFERVSMFNVLRAAERDLILRRNNLGIPDVPNGLRYSATLSLIDEMPLARFQREVELVLKGRFDATSKELLLDKKLYPLRAIIAQMSLTKWQQKHLTAWLESKET